MPLRIAFHLTLLFVAVNFIALKPAWADRICVKNYIINGVDLCKFNPTERYAYVYPENSSPQFICIMTYPDERCKFNKLEFAHVKTHDGKIRCTLNFNQPSSAGNYCASEPQNYSYALDPWR